jgi:multidrug transporter EmrE-like cation transporter
MISSRKSSVYRIFQYIGITENIDIFVVSVYRTSLIWWCNILRTFILNSSTCLHTSVKKIALGIAASIPGKQRGLINYLCAQCDIHSPSWSRRNTLFLSVPPNIFELNIWRIAIRRNSRVGPPLSTAPSLCPDPSANFTDKGCDALNFCSFHFLKTILECILSSNIYKILRGIGTWRHPIHFFLYMLS